MFFWVLDTNTVISAHLLRDSVSRKAYDLAFEKGMVLSSDETINEFINVFTQSKFDNYISLETRLDAIQKYESRSLLTEVIQAVDVCRDPKDNKFLSLAKSASADCIITGDNDLLILHPFEEIAILSPSDFYRKYK